MRKFFIIALICGMLSASCTKEYEVHRSTQQRDYLPKPTRTQVDETEDDLMVLGPQLNNPYSLQTMRQARFQLLEQILILIFQS